MSLCSRLTRQQCVELYADVLEQRDQPAMRRLCQEDLFFLLFIACCRRDINRDWLYDRCREVEENPDGYLDLWAREHYKSTIITFGKTIQDLLKDPEITISIFSHTRPIAKAFLNQIKREYEVNTFLQELFPDILYRDPQKDAPKWSLDNGIIVKRKSNPKEATVEAWGLIDGQPTSKHFRIRVYDDVVVRESVTNPEQIQKTTEAWEQSLNLGTDSQGVPSIVRYIGTRWHKNDTYREIITRGAAVERKHTGSDNGKVDGRPVLLTQAVWDKKRTDMGPYTFAAQILQDPTADEAQGFKEDWLSFYNVPPDYKGWNLYLLCDPANAKKVENDYTVMGVLGLAPDNNYYLLDGIRDRLNLTERTTKLMQFHRRYKPLVTGYEHYGMQSDVQHIKYVQEQENYRFEIKELGGQMPKPDRIRRLIPIFEQHRFWMPHQLFFVDYEKRPRDLIRAFIEDEYKPFPVAVHDDIFDMMARILDDELGAKFPVITAPEDIVKSVQPYDPLKTSKEKAPQVYNPLALHGSGGR